VAKPSLAARCESIVSIVNSSSKSKIVFPRIYHVEEDEDGSRLLLFEKNNDEVVRYASKQALVSDILSLQENAKGFDFTHSQAKDVANYVVARKSPLKEKPEMLKFKSETGLCFNRVPFDPDFDDTKCQLFLEMLSRTSNGHALAAFVGSLLVPHSDKEQYIWLYGDGMNGKGTLIRFLMKVLGNCYASEEVPEKGQRFWTHGLLGKRLVAFTDCKSTEFQSEGRFRALTGNDAIRIEAKNGGVYNKTLDAKFMFLSNEMPILEDNKADLRRAIFCEIGPIKEVTKGYEEMLWQEAPYIIGHCITAYSKYSPGKIPVDETSFDDVMAVDADSMQAIFDRNFYFVDGQQNDHAMKFTGSELRQKNEKTMKFLTGSELQHVLIYGAMMKRKTERSKFLSFLRKKYSCKSKTFRWKNQVLRGYIGLASKQFVFDRTGNNFNKVFRVLSNEENADVQ